jgi:hypothetical protein
MVRQIFIISMLIAVSTVISAVAPGCSGSEFALMAPLAKPQAASDQSSDNWNTATATVHDTVLQELEDRFQAKLLTTNNPAKAVKELAMYATRTQVPKDQPVDLELYAEVRDTNLLVLSPLKPGQLAIGPINTLRKTIEK